MKVTTDNYCHNFFVLGLIRYENWNCDAAKLQKKS